MPNYGVIKEVFPSQEDIINDDVETNIIEEPEEDPSIPTKDEDSGQGGAGLPVQMALGDAVEPDSNDIIWPIEEIELNEPEVQAEEYNVEPVVSNQATLPTLGAVNQGDRCIIALVNGEATVIGTVGSGDAQNARISAVEQVAGDTNQYFWHSSTGTDTGAHITQIPQEQFVANPSGGNTLIRSNGMAVRDGLTELARFTSTGAQIGKDNSANILISPSGIRGNKNNETKYFEIVNNDGNWIELSFVREEDDDASEVPAHYADESTIEATIGGVAAKWEVTGTRTIDGVEYAWDVMVTDMDDQWPEIGKVVKVKYKIVDTAPFAPADYTFGTRVENQKKGVFSFTAGEECKASGWTAFAGNNSYAEGSYSATFGHGMATGYDSFATGTGHASGYGSHAEASGQASGTSSHAEGNGQASAYTAHAEGAFTKATGHSSHAEGYKTTASGSSAHSEGRETVASGDNSHAEGRGTASGECSHAEGTNTFASGKNSHVEGLNSFADGVGTHAEGNNCRAVGGFSHAEGNSNVANGNYSHVNGFGNEAYGTAQTVIGKDNIRDTYTPDAGQAWPVDIGKYAFIIGNGTSSNNRSNAFTVDWEGNVECGKVNGVDVTQGGGGSDAGIRIFTGTSSNIISTAGINNIVKGATVEVPAGKYIIVGRWNFDTATATGTTNKSVRIYNDNTETELAQERYYAGAYNYSTNEVTCIVEVSETTTFSVRGSSSRKTESAQENTITAVKLMGGGNAIEYLEGTGIDITNDAISVDNTVVPFKTDLATVATSGDYADLSNKPTIPAIPTNVSSFTNDAGYLSAIPSEYITDTELATAIAGKANSADLATVATSGAYADLTGKPTIPTVPTNISAFTNDAGYLTSYTESDPVFSASAASGITSADITNWNSKLDNLTAGDNITISNGTISAKDTKYTAGSNITITATNQIRGNYSNATTTSSGLMSATDKDYLDKISTTNGYYSEINWIDHSDGYSYVSTKKNSGTGSHISTLFTVYPAIDSTKTSNKNIPSMKAVSDALDTKQNTLTAGSNITISNGTISATDTTYTAGSGISIVNGVISLDLSQAESESF